MRNEGVQLIQFHRLDLGGCRYRAGQLVSRRVHPINHRLMMDTEEAGDAPEIEPIDIVYERLCPQFIGVALRFGIGRIALATGTTPQALTGQRG